jgi:hypothetical protein
MVENLNLNLKNSMMNLMLIGLQLENEDVVLMVVVEEGMVMVVE